LDAEYFELLNHFSSRRVSEAFSRVLLGLILGLPLAMGAGRLISAQLYGVSPWDLQARAAAAGALALSSFLAAIIPAGSAALISPMRPLRTE
jgi:hypothetical protein